MSSTPGQLWHPSLWPLSRRIPLSWSIYTAQGRRRYTPQQRRAMALARRATPKACQGMPAQAVTALWHRQDSTRSSTSVLPWPSYHCVEHRLPALYTPDTIPSLPLLHRRRPLHFTAARPVIDFGCARAIASRLGLASYGLSIARTPASPSRPRLALSLATGATPWPFLLSTPRHLPPPINSDDRHSFSSHNPLPSPH
jgi:hypothetical protein